MLTQVRSYALSRCMYSRCLVGANTGRREGNGGCFASSTLTGKHDAHHGCNHNGENPASDGGSGANGPHISSNIHILERPYTMNVVPNPGQPVQSLIVSFDPRSGTFALCDKCHDLSGMLGDGSTVDPKAQFSSITEAMC